tara:strand:- start:57 stop:419 length:363 start_codon:yes stop_codon:yes gene_type:complete
MKHLPLGGAETERSRNLIKGETLKLEKNKYYRVTDQNGKKFRGSFDSKLSVLGQKCLRFCWEHHIIAVDLIKNVEQVEIITPDSQAREQGCWDEFKHYGTIKGKKAKRKFIYKELNKRGN